MPDPEGNNLTPERVASIILTEDETRFITNLRIQAKRNPYAKLAVLIQVHDGEVQYGTLCLGAAPDTSTIRL